MKRPLIVILGLTLIMGTGSQSLGEDTGVLRGSDDGTTKRILKTQADGSLLLEVTGELDPKVAAGTLNFIPKWNGTALVDGIIYDNGNIGIGTAAPGAKLEVAGQVKITGGLPGAGKVLTSNAAGLADWQAAVGHGDGADCAAGNYPLGVDANGAVQGCTIDDDTPDTDAEVPDNISINNTRLFAPAGAGNVGIGTTSPTEKLDVVGNIAVTGTVDGVDISAHAADPNAHHAPPAVVPAGTITFFNLASCPSGWTEATAARGRSLVGLPLSGTLAGTAGMALTNLEDRSIGQHGHTVTDPGHQHDYTGPTGGVVLADFSVVPPTGYGGAATTGSSATGVTVNSQGTTAGTNAPYLQLLLCEKS